MASTSEPPNDCSMEKHLTCSICMETFTDPVTTPCGHSFCKKCLDISMFMNSMCPLCKKYLNKTPDANIVLRDIVQQMKTQKKNANEKYSGAAGEIACEVCIKPKLKAKKSCLMCPASYCSIHLESHYSSARFKGHKLVEPVENLDTRACLTHGRPLELYSRKQQRCICVQCMGEGEEGVVTTENEWIKKKGHLENTRTVLQQKITMRKTKMDEINTALKGCKKYPTLSLQDEMKNWADVELDTSLTFGIMRETTTTMIEKIQQELEKLAFIEIKRLPKFLVDVKLNPNTAHQRLVLSDDWKEVRDGGKNQEVADSPERFDLFGSVLGLNSLTPGRSYWEMEVGSKTGWDLGVTRGGAKRKGKLTLSPGEGYWVLVHYEEEKYAAMTEPPVRLSLKKKPEKVGVFVDYEEGLVSFYDVKTQSHIYTFKDCVFKGDLYPYFSPHMVQDEKNSEPLVIFAEKNCEMVEV
ncbi:E3 ubiquitin-protein ligase TRIM39 isoform X3 [Kryptolebias marmoratus]|uniref:E3 ubiquitin-protein ligase TRIM39 isoform X3 n=1 Tax=Kryptolebias marmoratus TaxID=37003 RepID=UPI0007F882AC|nr:E3 ubiquitin-protein ligase TRIM39 isoform X3 [Kryptolebias marmoratus]